MIYGKVADIQS